MVNLSARVASGSSTWDQGRYYYVATSALSHAPPSPSPSPGPRTVPTSAGGSRENLLLGESGRTRPAGAAAWVGQDQSEQLLTTLSLLSPCTEFHRVSIKSTYIRPGARSCRLKADHRSGFSLRLRLKCRYQHEKNQSLVIPVGFVPVSAAPPGPAAV